MTTLATVNAYYHAILRVAPPPVLAETYAEEIDGGTITLAQFEDQLIGQALNSTIPALVVYDAFFDMTPFSAGLDFLTGYANQLQAQGFSLQNVYVNLGASFITVSPFAAQYGAMDRATFLTTIYTKVFDVAPSADAQTYLLSQFDFYKNFTGSELGARGAIYGILLSISDSNAGAAALPNGKYVIPAGHFLEDAVNNVAPYGSELVATYGAGNAVIFQLTDNVAHNVTEGNPIVFTLNTTNVLPGAVESYTITGPGASQVQIPLTGSLVVDAFGHATLTAPTLANVFDGSQHNITLALTNGAAADTVTIHEASQTITDNGLPGVPHNSVNEGGSVTFTINTSSVAPATVGGTVETYILSGIDPTRVVGGQMSGQVVLDLNGHATVNVGIVNDHKTDGPTNLTISLTNGAASDTVAVIDTSLNPTFTIVDDATPAIPYDTVVEGHAVTFLVTATDVPPGTLENYVLVGPGITQISGPTSGQLVVDANGHATLTVNTVANVFTGGSNNLSLVLTNAGAFDTVKILEATQSITDNGAPGVPHNSVNEGSSVTFTLNTALVPPGAVAGTVENYILSGLDPSRIAGGQTTGVVVLDSNGQAQVTVGILADNKTDGPSNLTISLTNGAAQDTVTVNDTSKAPTFVITDDGMPPAPDSVIEGNALTFTLTTTDVPPGTLESYVLSGVGTSQISSPTSGQLVVDATGHATLTVNTLATVFTGGSAPITMTLTNGSGASDTAKIIEATQTITDNGAPGVPFDTVNEGSSVVFTVHTSLVSPGAVAGKVENFVLSGIDSSRIVGGQMSGQLVLDANGNATVTVGIVDDHKTEGPTNLTISLTNGAAADTVTINDTSLSPTFTLTNTGPVNEGNPVVFNLATTDVPPGTTENFVLSGATNQVNGPLTGTMTVDAFGNASVTIQTLLNVYNIPGNTAGLTLNLIGPGAPASSTATIDEATATITDLGTDNPPSPPNHYVEGSTVLFTLTTSLVPAGTQFTYTLTGAAASQVNGPTTGTLTVDGSGHATLLVKTLADNFTGVSNPLTLVLNNVPSATDTVLLDETAQAVFILTPGSDNFTGVSNQNNLFIGDLTLFIANGIGPTLNSNDHIHGGANGPTFSNTFIINDDFAVANDILPAGVDITNIQHFVLNTAGNAGSALTLTNFSGAFDTTGVTGVVDVTINSTGNHIDYSKSGATVDVTDNQHNITGGVLALGGKDVTINAAGGGGVQVGDGTAANDPTGAINITDTYADQVSDSEFGILTFGGTTVTINVTSPFWDDPITVDPPTGDVTINDAGAGVITVIGGAKVNVTTAGGSVHIGDPTGSAPQATGAIVVTDTAPHIFNSLGDVTKSSVDDPGEADITIVGGTTVNVTTNTGAVFIGTATSVPTTNPTGDITVTDTATDSDGLREELPGNEGLPSEENILTITSVAPFTPSPSFGLDDDKVGTEADVIVFGGHNVTVNGNANIVIGSNAFFDSTDNKADPTGTVIATETSSTTFYTEGQFHEDNFIVAVNGGTSTTITAHGQDVYAGTNSGVGGPVIVTQQALLTGDGWGMDNGNVVVLGGTTVTVNTTGGDVLIGGIDALGVFKAPTGAVNVTNTYAGGNGPNDEDIVVLGGTTVNITTTATRGHIDVGAGHQWWLEPPNALTPQELDGTGAALLNPALYPTGNVTIVNASQYGAPNFWSFGREDTNVFMNGGTTLSIVGGEIGEIADAQATIATGGPGAGKAIGVSKLATVVLDGIRTDISGGPVGGAYIYSDALTNLSVFDVFEHHEAEITVVDNAASQSLNLTVGNVSSVTVNDATAQSITISTGLGVLGKAVPPNDEHGLVPDPNELFLNANSATSLTFTNNANLALSHEAPDIYLDAVTKITASNSGSLALGDWSDNLNLATVDAKLASGDLSIEINPGITSVLGSISGSKETVTITQNAILGVVQGGSVGSTIVADYAASKILIGGFETDTQLSGSTSGFTNLALGENADSFNTGVNGTYVLGLDPYYDASGFTGLIVGEVAGNVAFVNVGGGSTHSLTITETPGFTVSYLQIPGQLGPLNLIIGVDGNRETGSHDIDAHVATGDSVGSVVSTITTINITSLGWTGGDEENTLRVGDSAATTMTIKGDQSIEVHLKTDNLGDLDTGNTGTFSLVTSIDASGFTGVGQEVDVRRVDVNFNGATFTGGAGRFEATGEQLFATGPGDDGGTVGNDLFTTGSGGGRYELGAGGAWDTRGPGGFAAENGTGSETVVLTASKAVSDTLVADIQNAPFSVFNGTKGGVTDFQVLASGPSDVIDFENGDPPPYGATQQLFNTKAPQIVGALSDVLSAAETFEPTTFLSLLTTFNDITYSASNGVISFSWIGPPGTTAEELMAAEVIVNDGAKYFSDTGNGVDLQQALVAEFVGFDGNTYVVSSDPSDTLANNKFGFTNPNLTTVIELKGISSVTGFGNTPAVGAVATNPDTANYDLKADSVFNLTGSAANNYGTSIDPPTNFLTSVGNGTARTLDYNPVGGQFSVATFAVDGTASDNHDVTTFKNLAPSSTLVLHNTLDNSDTNLGNIVVTQTGASGSNSLTVALDPWFSLSDVTDTLGNTWSNHHTGNDITIDVVKVSGDNLVVFDNETNTSINTLQDATNTLANVIVTDAPHSFELGGITGTVLKVVDATDINGDFTLGDANPLAQNGLTIKVGDDSSGNVAIYTSGSGDTIDIKDANSVKVDAGLGTSTTVTVHENVSDWSHITANGGGANISVKDGDYDIHAMGVGNTITFGEHADDQSYVHVGNNSTVNLGESNEQVDVAGNVVGAGGSASPAMTTINNVETGQNFTVKFDAAVNEGVNQDFSNGSGDIGMWQGVVNVTGGGATTLAQALDIAATHTHALGNELGGAIFGEGDLPGHQNGDISWFVWGGNTYVVEAINLAAHAQDHVNLQSQDIVVKLTGVIDLSGSTLNSTGHLHI